MFSSISDEFLHTPSNLYFYLLSFIPRYTETFLHLHSSEGWQGENRKQVFLIRKKLSAKIFFTIYIQRICCHVVPLSPEPVTVPDLIRGQGHTPSKQKKEGQTTVFLQSVLPSIYFHSITFFPEYCCISFIIEQHTTFFEFQWMNTIIQGCQDNITETSWNPNFISFCNPHNSPQFCVYELWKTITSSLKVYFVGYVLPEALPRGTWSVVTVTPAHPFLMLILCPFPLFSVICGFICIDWNKFHRIAFKQFCKLFLCLFHGHHSVFDRNHNSMLHIIHS